MKPRHAFCIILTGGWLSCLVGAGAEDDLPAIVRTNVNHLSKIRSAWCAYRREGTDNGKLVKVATGECAVRPDAMFFDYVQEADQGEFQGVVTWSQRFTWNGKQAYDFLRYPDRRLAIYDYWFACPTTEASTVFLDAFDFLLGDRDTRSGSCLMLAQMADVAEWEKWARNATVVGHEKLAIGECLVVACAGRTFALDRFNGPYTMRVWFDSEHDYYPVQWERISKEGKSLERYTIVSLGCLDEKESLVYPRVSETVRNEAGGSRTIVTAVENGRELTDDALKIDPALAEKVWDGAAKKYAKMNRGFPTARDLWYYR